MATVPDKQWGTTPPISTILPTAEEIAANDALIAELKKENNFEAPQETEKRFELILKACHDVANHVQ